MAKNKTGLARKLFCGLLVMLLLSVFVLPVSAAEIAQDSIVSSEPTLVSRIVYPEETDPEELLKMAMEQEPAPMTRSAAPGNDEITVKQLLEEQTFSDGSIKKVYAQSTLLVLDDEGNKLSRSDYYHSSKTGGNSKGNVFASQTAYIETTSNAMIRITHVTTIISEMGIATPVTKFTHAITKNEIGQEDVINKQTISSPQMGTPYTYYNPTKDFYSHGHLGTFLQTSAVIYLADGSSFDVLVIVQ